MSDIFLECKIPFAHAKKQRFSSIRTDHNIKNDLTLHFYHRDLSSLRKELSSSTKHKKSSQKRRDFPLCAVVVYQKIFYKEESQ